MLNNTPPINATGTYVLLPPFEAVSGAVYRCEAIDGFESLEERGVDIFTLYYSPNGLDTTQLDDDRVNGVNIVTLMSDNHPSIYVPSSYIDKYPTTTTVPYSRVILSVDLGALPDGINLKPAIDYIMAKTAEVIGVPDPGVQLHLVTVTEPVSFSQHETLELNRADRIVSQETPAAANARLTQTVANLMARNDEYAAHIIDLNAIIDALENP